MNKCLIIPDSFKGTLSAIDVCSIMEDSVKSKYPDCNVKSYPIADGGEGTVDCFLRIWPSGSKIGIKVNDPFGNLIDSFYGKFGDIAVVEMAAASGLGLCKELNPMTASTYGVGQLIKSAIDNRCTTIILGLGGSCTNDGGTGMAAALGTKFYDRHGKVFVPAGGTLSEIAKIDTNDTDKLLEDIDIRVMCDIDNPMIGENGATYVFAPQKGATKKTMAILEQNMKDFSKTIARELKMDVASVKGGGAAGALGAGALAFLHGKLEKGIDVILDLIKFGEIAKDCDFIFTGEGRLDTQSLRGKAVIGIGKRAKHINIPVIAVVGTVEKKLPDLHDYGVIKVYPTTYDSLPEYKNKEELKAYCENTLKKTMKEVLSSI